MNLSPGQVSTLDEMGIPVWELRGQQTIDNFATDSEPNLEELTDKFLSHDWIIIIDQHAHNESTERLLKSMLFTIDVSVQQYIIVPDSYIEHIHLQSIKPKILLAFGDKTAQKILGTKSSVDNSRGKIHQVLHPELTTIVSFGLDELLSHPENKVFAWLDLQLARSVSEQWK